MSDEAAADPLTDEEFLERFRTAFLTGAEGLGLSFPDPVVEGCGAHCLRVCRANVHVNLTRILEPEEMAVKHALDSLTVLDLAPEWRSGGLVADVGTGAGFPGIPLRIACPEIDLLLVDSLRKRLDFLSAASPVPFTGIHARAEDAGRDVRLREQCDGVVARALAPLPILLEWCGPLVRPGGSLVAMLGPSDAGEGAPRDLGLALAEERRLTLPDGEGSARRLRVYRKVRPTPARYPRRPSEIKAHPLGG